MASGERMNQQQPFDPGLTQQFGARLRRAINKDGSFNVQRKGARLRHANLYLYLINTSWTKFSVLALAGYLTVNTLFAGIYVLLGCDSLHGAEPGSRFDAFLNAFFFSAHTLTTVGYGNIYPSGVWPNVVAALEAMTGLMAFAIATGLLYGRFSRPSARIVFSRTMLVAPYRDGTSLQFRIANQRKNVLMEIESKVLLMTVENIAGQSRRNYFELNLERSYVNFLPLTWTIVHPIDSSSPLMGKSASDLEALQAEVLILIKSFDDTFSQVVHTRYSYRYGEIVWGAKFTQAFHIDESGDLILELERIHDYSRAEIPQPVA